MRVSITLCTAMLLALSASGASALDANEIFNRLQAQSDALATGTAAPRTDRGFNTGVVYGEPEPTATPAPAVVEAPAALPAPSAPQPSTTVTLAAPAAPPPQRLPEPVYRMESPAPSTVVTLAPTTSGTATTPASVATEPASATTFQPAPDFAQIPTYVATQPQEPVQRVAVRTNPAEYRSVDTDKRVDLRIFFEWNSASLRPEAISQLAELCTAIRRMGASPDNRFKIIGHTDKSGSDEYNLYLSNARAREVKRHLVEECSLPSNSLLAVGEGERQSSPNTPSNAPQERRVEIQFVS